MVSATWPDDWARALDCVADRILRQCAIDSPPVDAFMIARRLGIVVAHDESLPQRARFVRLAAKRGRPSQGAIVLGSEPRAERRHWAVAHEIGETLSGELFQSLDVDPRTARPGLREAVASAIAGRLLLPRAAFFDAAALCDFDLFALKERFATASHELIARRMLDGALPVIVTVVDQGVCGFRRSNVPGRVPALTAPERDLLRRVHESGGSADTDTLPPGTADRMSVVGGGPGWGHSLPPCGGGLGWGVEGQTEDSPTHRPGYDSAVRPGAFRLLRVQAWAIHEPPWQREILRSELDAEQSA